MKYWISPYPLNFLFFRSITAVIIILFGSRSIMTRKPPSASNQVLEANQLAGTRLELLLFKLNGRQQFGINVFKVQEIIPQSEITKIPGAHPLVQGIATLRGITMPILDLSQAVGGPPLRDLENSNIIITEYNRSVHGFMVGQVQRIVNTDWENVHPRPSGIGKNSFVNAITLIDGDMVEILDVEKVLDQVVDADTSVSDDITSRTDGARHQVLVVDDSSVARKQITRALEQIGVDCIAMEDGKSALELIDALVADGVDVGRHFAMVVSDIEMPEMDGYMFTTALRKNPATESIYILLHSSISGEFNMDMVEKTGANDFIQKYDANDLAQVVLDHL